MILKNLKYQNILSKSILDDPEPMILHNCTAQRLVSMAGLQKYLYKCGISFKEGIDAVLR